MTKKGLKLTGGLGFPGMCTRGNNKFKKNQIKNNSIRKFVNGVVLPITNFFTGTANFCLGDFNGSEIGSSKNMANTGCSAFPLPSNSIVGLFSGNMYDVPCAGDSNVNACFIFNDVTLTYGFTFNGGLLQCGLDMTGVGAGLMPLTEFLGDIALGFSAQAEFKSSVELCYNPMSQHARSTHKPKKHPGILCSSRTVRANIFISLDISLPHFTIAGKDLSDYFQINIGISMYIDYGGNVQKFHKYHRQLSSGKSDKAQKHEIAKRAASDGAEFTVNITGSITINFQNLTKGFIPNMNINLGVFNLLVSSGKGPSGLARGVYTYIESNILKSLLDDVFGKYKKAFKEVLDIVDGLGIKFGLFFDELGSGFLFELDGFKFQCIWDNQHKKGSCQFKNKFLTAILKGVKWAIHEAEYLFDEAGKLIAEFEGEIDDLAKGIEHEAEKIWHDIWSGW